MTDSEFNLRRTLKKKGELNRLREDPTYNRIHLKDSVGELLCQTGGGAAQKAKSTRTEVAGRHNVSSMAAILQHNEDYK